MATVPRYQAFTDYSRAIAEGGSSFTEIAGNRGEVVWSVLAQRSWPLPAGSRVLFQQPILTAPGTIRVVLASPVGTLADHLRGLTAAQELEHVYDF